jgi:hypothetical protein
MYLSPFAILFIVIVVIGILVEVVKRRREQKQELVRDLNETIRLLRYCAKEDFAGIVGLDGENRRLDEKNKQLEQANARAHAVLWALLEKAQARYEPYAGFDMPLLSQRMDAETFEQLSIDVAAAKGDLDFLTQALYGPDKSDQGNFKDKIAAAAAAARAGRPVSLEHVHQAIDALTQAGRFTSAQGASLKSHNGPLLGSAGVHTVDAITHQLVTSPSLASA